ncbi:MAG: hypothetical protein QOH62_1043 [Solirubrobacteraceae bacterium]|nr:hypothetical protein [Solirubrobacteraceae bacterium]
MTTPTLRIARRRLAVLAAAAFAVVPVAGCGSSGSSAGGADDPAKAIPASAPVYLEATIRPTGKQRTDLEASGRKVLGTSDPAAKIRELIDKAGSKEGKSFDKDIKPWLGSKAAIAVTSVAAGQPQFAVVVDSTDDAKARKLIEDDSSYKTKRSFEGTDYRFDPEDGTAAGVIDNYLVVASEPSFKQVATLLDKGGNSLADNKDLQTARAKVGGRPGFAFVDLQGLVRTVASDGAANLGPTELAALNSIFKSFRAFGIGASADAQAVRLSLASLGSGSGTGRGPGAALPLEQAPGTAWLAFSQKDLGKTISGVLTSLENANSGSAGGTISDTITQLETATGLKVKEDLLSWMGDAGLFVEGDSLPALGGALVVQSTDPAKTRAAILKIKGLLRQFNQPVGATPPGTSPGFTLKVGTRVAPLQIGLAGSKFVIALGKTALRDAIRPKSTLGSKAAFKSASGLLGATAKPSFYVDFRTVTRFIGLIGGSSPSFQRAKPYLDAFTAAIGGGANGKTEIAIGLK